MNTVKENNPLGYEKIPKLLARFAIPSVVAMIVSALYNIVDQIFIGNNVGPIGNAATNVAFPFTTICMAIAVLVGIGGASRFSIELGRKNYEESRRCIGNALWSALGLSVAFAVISGVFLEPMLGLFGATSESLPYAVDYMKYIVFGMPFLVLSSVLSNFIRADGSPNFSMICMIIGAVTNTVLDAVFVCDWGLNMGMAGAAIATVISQVVSCVAAALYLFRFKTVKLDRTCLAFDIRRALRIAALGMSNCVNQVAICAVQIVLNQTLKKWGALDPVLGADIPIAAFGIVMKVNSIFISIFIGIAQGSQPIIGYNYGAGQYRRARKVCTLAAKICFAAATVGCFAFQVFPEVVLSIFGSGDQVYMDFAVMTMRTFLMMIMLNSLQFVFSNYFSAIGKPMIGVILSMTRQVILVIPLMIVLPYLFGDIYGVLYAAPITDFISFVLAAVFIFFEFKKPAYKKENK